MIGLGKARSHSVELSEPSDPDVQPPQAPAVSVVSAAPKPAPPAAAPQEPQQETPAETSGELKEKAARPATNGAAPRDDNKEESIADEASLFDAGQIDIIQCDTFGELRLVPAHIEAIRAGWNGLLAVLRNPELAGDAIYGALYDSAPSMQGLFRTPRAVVSVRFMSTFAEIVAKVHDPIALKSVIEILAFLHLQVDISVPRVAAFRDGLLELFQVEIGDSFTSLKREGWAILMNYIGGAIIYIRTVFSERLKIIDASWLEVTKKQEQHLEEHHDDITSPKEKKGKRGKPALAIKLAVGKEDELAAVEEGRPSHHFGSSNVPKTFDEMFTFNAAVMGFGGESWMDDVLKGFGPMVTNVSNSARLKEECDVMSLVISKCKTPIKLKDFKAVMLATLRSLLPQDWGTDHELAWTWLWEMIERLLLERLGKPLLQERALNAWVDSMTEEQKLRYKTEVYEIFFEKCKLGQDYFKQSITRMHYIAERTSPLAKVMGLTLEMYKDPNGVIDQLSALGLRHVGYGIPTEFFNPFVSANIESVVHLAKPQRTETVDGVTRVIEAADVKMVVCPWDKNRMMAEDEIPGELAVEAYRWSISLVSRVLIRAITEGSTIVMTAINLNNAEQLRKSVSCAPRGVRAQWMLKVTVGTQTISPLMWAIQSGSLDGAKGILEDLLTIRADRENYYYAVDDLFHRHPDIVNRLCVDAPSLLIALLDNLIWRARLTENGQRRVIYYVRHFIVDPEGGLSRSLARIIQYNDTDLICHPAVVVVMESVWNDLAMQVFVYNKLYFVLTLIIFVLSQSILPRIPQFMEGTAGPAVILAGRAFIYIASLGQLTYRHCRLTVAAYKGGETVRRFCLPFPSYLSNWRESTSLVLLCVLFIMLILEPILRCMQHGLMLTCDSVSSSITVYQWFNFCANMLYFALVIDLTVLSTSLSAYVLVCGRMVREVFLCLFAVAFMLVAFSCGICTMSESHPDFQNVADSLIALLRIAFGQYSSVSMDLVTHSKSLFLFVLMFTIITWVFLLNLLIGQLNCIYTSCYEDMLGFAQLNRGHIILETMPTVAPRTWEAYVTSLGLDQRLEFSEGDIGLTGGLRRWEPANHHPVTTEQIKRYGGTTNKEMPWPDTFETDTESDRVDKMEKNIQKTLAKIWKGLGQKKGGPSTSAGGSSQARGSSSAGKKGDSDSVHSKDELDADL